MKKLLKISAGVLLVVFLISMTGCGDLFATYTVKVKSFHSSSIYTVKYRDSGTTEWKTADLKDEDGGYVIAVDSGVLWDTEAYFDLPGAGTYDFSVYNVLGTQISIISDEVVDIDLGSISDYDYVLSLGSDGVIDFY